MFTLISRCKPVFLGMAFLSFLMAFPGDRIFAAVIATETSAADGDAGRLRARILYLLAREEVRGTLLQHGITASEAEARVNALTDQEVIRISRSIESIVSGGNRSNTQNDPAWVTKTDLLVYLGAFAAGIVLWFCVQLIKYLLNPPKTRATRAPTSIPVEGPSDSGQTEPVPPLRN
jgi:hypothetical protein